MTMAALGTGKRIAVFVAIDHREGSAARCVGLPAAERAPRSEALEPGRRGVKEGFGPAPTEIEQANLPI